jgi:hypothetical protein
MNAPTRFNTAEEYNRAVKRLEELRRNPTASNQDEQRTLSESIAAYRQANPQGHATDPDVNKADDKA